MNEFQELGSGFLLANRDLEIRGAGEILGENQSGEINSIGYGLYLKLLNVEIEKLKSSTKLSVEQNSFSMKQDWLR